MSAIDDLLNSANERRSTAAGPAGFYDAAVRQQQQQRSQQSGSAIDQLLNAHGGAFVPAQQTDMTGTYRNWYTGQNLQGTGSGWDTEFHRAAQEGVTRAYEEGRLLEYFAQDDATGVVTWDNAAGPRGRRFGWGDVVVRGEKVGNVYEDFDRHTANVMMGEFAIETGARKRKLNQERDIEKAWEEELSEIRAKNTEMAEVAPRAESFEERVEKRVEREEDSRWKIAFSGGAGASVLGAGVGSFFGPVGTAVGGAVAFGAGFLGAYLNTDSLQYQVARSREQYELASKEGAGIQAALSGIAQNTMSIGFSPLGNLVQGTHDQIYGEGIRQGEIGGSFQATNDEGQRKAGGLWQAADLAGLLGDSALQFASWPARLAYQAQMTTQISAGVLGLMPGIGQWDDRRVKQINVWTSSEYNPETGQWEQKFDLGNALAGIGSVAIDAVQLGAISSLSRGVDRMASQTAAKTGLDTSRWAKPFRGENIFTKLNLSREQRAALKAGAQIETQSGYKFVVTEGGKLVGRQRMTLAMLAPSEGLQAMTAKMLARRDAARVAGAVRAEDLYQAAADLAIGQRGLTAMLVNAVGEGQEEALQAILDPLSMDHKLDGEEIIRAGLAGAVTGFGMTFGSRLGLPSQDMRMFAAAQLGHSLQTNGAVLSYEQWQGMSHLEKRVMVKSVSGLAESLTNSAFDKIERDRIRGIIGGAVEAQALEDYTRDEQESTLRTGAQATDQASPIVMHESYSFRPEAVATSHTQLLEHQMERTRAAVLQLNELNEEIAELKTDPAQAERLAALEATQVSLQREVQASQVLERTIARYIAEIDDAFERADLATAESAIDELNVMLEDMFDMSANTFELVMKDGSTRQVTLTDETLFAYSKAASRLMTRDPADSEGSWPILLPQVNKVYARRGADGLYAVSQIILKAIRGDYDGDKTRPLQQLVVPDDRYREIRAGSNILGSGTMPEIGSTKFEQQLAIVAMQSWDSRNIPLRDAARRVPREIERELFERYQNRAQGRNLIPTRVILEVTKAAQEELRSGGDVREKVLEILTARAGGRLLDIGRGEHVVSGMPRLGNEMYWVANMVTRHMSEFQNAYARLTPLQGEELHQPQAAAPAARTGAGVSSSDPAPVKRGVAMLATPSAGKYDATLPSVRDLSDTEVEEMVRQALDVGKPGHVNNLLKSIGSVFRVGDPGVEVSDIVEEYRRFRETSLVVGVKKKSGDKQFAFGDPRYGRRGLFGGTALTRAMASLELSAPGKLSDAKNPALQQLREERLEKILKRPLTSEEKRQLEAVTRWVAGYGGMLKSGGAQAGDLQPAQDLVKSAPTTGSTLYRGLKAPIDQGIDFSRLQPGEQFTHGVTSWTEDAQVAGGFRGSSGTGVMLRMVGDKQALPLGGLYGTNESLTGGTYEFVREIQTDSGVIYEIRQVESVSGRRLAGPAPAAPTATDVPSGTPARAATEGGTAANVLPGTNMFRMFQKLHYTLWETTEKYAGWATDAKRDEYMQLVQLYEQLSQGVNEQRLERMSPSDQILGDVMTWLERMAASPMELQRLGLTQMGDMAVIANTSVPQMVFERDDNGVERLRFTGKDISIGQHLLYLALHKFKKANFEVWDRDATLSAAYNNLIQLTKPQTQGDKNSFPGNAEMAFVTIFEGVRAYDLVGIEAVSLGVNRTVGQIYRELTSQSPEERQEQKYALRSGGAYAEADKDATIPFSPDENRANASNAYKALIDSLFSAADSTISKNRTGQDIGATTGRLAKKSNDRGESIQETYRSVLQLLQTIEPRKGGYSAEDVSRIANQHREFGSMLMKAIPSNLMPVVFRRYDEVTGNPVFASWFYEVWTQPSAEQAEMSYFRNLIVQSWLAKVHAIDLDSSFSDAAVKGIAYHNLDSRMHRIMFNLAARSTVDPTPLKAFLTRLNEAQSVKKFMKYVNTDPTLPTEGAPYVAWVDDVAEFDPERAGGGWASQLSTPTLMEHINNLRSTADRMVTDIQAANERSKQDLKTARRIERWHKHLQNPEDLNQWVDWKKDKDEYERFVALLKESAKRRMANGPRAMLQHTSHLVYGLYGPAHAKGANPEQLAANAALEAMDNAFGFLTNAERALGDLTTHNEDSVARAPQMILRDGGRTMTRHGAEVTWELDAVEAMLPLMTEEKNHPLMRSVLFDTVIELDTDNVARRKFLMGSTLDEVLNRSTVRELFNEKKNPDLTQAMKFLTKMEQGLRDTQKHQIEQKVTELVLLRTTALDHTASFEEIQSMTVQAYMDMAALLQVVGRTKKRPGEEDPAEKAYRQLREAALVASISSAYNIDAKIVNGSLTNLQDLVKKELLQAHDDRIDKLIKQLRQSGLSATTRSQLEDALKTEKSVRKAKQAKVDRMFDLNVTDQIVAQYHYSTEASDAEKHQRQTDLMEYVYRNGELMQAAGPALITVQTIKNHYRERAIDQKLRPLKLPDKAWETLSNVIISVEIQQLLTVGPASKPPPPYPSALEPGAVGLDKRKYWDHSGSYLFDFLSEDDTTGIVEVARDLAQRQAGMVVAQFDEVDIVNKVKSTLMRDGSIGTWTPIIPILNIESHELLTGASANPSISMHGLLQRRWGAAMMATRRQTTDTVADATVTLTAEDLNWSESNLFHDVTVTAGNGVEYQRPLAMMNNRFAEELSFTYEGPDGTRSDVIDLMSRFNVARQWSGAQGDTTRFREVNILRLSEELERLILEAHPDAGQAELNRMRDSIEVSMRFVNPDAQPASTAQELRDHANSVWHEGTVYATDGDVGPSLIEAFFYGIGALNPRGQQAALDTRKLGLMGIEDYNRPRFEAVLEMEKAAGTDFARMLALKTNVLMDTKISKGKPIDPQFYNAAYKLMKLKHWVEGTIPGTDTTTRWSAEQVIAWQMQNPGKDIFGAEGPLENAKLWIPSDQVLADMLGDIGYGGVTGRALKRGVELDLDTIPLYTSQWTEDMESKFPIVNNSKETTLLDTDVARQSFVQDLNVSSYLTPQERSRFQRRVEQMNRQVSAAQQQRVDTQRKSFNPKRNLQQNMTEVIGWVSKRDVDVSFPPGLEFLEANPDNLLQRTKDVLTTYTNERAAEVGRNNASFWIYQEEGVSNAEEGRLTKSDLGGNLNIVPGEVVFFDVDPYRNEDPAVARERAMRQIEFFVSKGAAIMVGSSRGSDSLIAELQYEIQTAHRYQRYEGDSTILVPDVFDEGSFQNVAAARSRLVVPTPVNISRQAVSMLLLDQEVEENSMWVPVRPGRRTKFDTMQAVFDLLPTDANSKFNTVNTRDEAEMVGNWIAGLGDLNDPGVEMLRQEALRHLYVIDGDGKATKKLKKGVTQAQVDKEAQAFNEAWENLVKAMPARIEAGTTLPLPGETNIEFIPLLNSQTNEMMLYRHGYKYPTDMDYLRQLKNQVPGSSGVRGVVMYSGKRESSATVHPSARVVNIVPSPGRGLRMEMEIPVPELGSKIVVEHNGMKYVRTNAPENLALPEGAIFGDIEIDGFASLHDVMSKEATDGLVTSFQNAFAMFGIDFTEDVKRFFGTDSTDAAVRTLRQIAALGEKQSVEDIYELQSLLAGSSSYLSLIEGLISTNSLVGTNFEQWGGRLREETPEAAIVRAMIVYLMSPNANVDAILSSSGFHVNNPSLPNARSLKMPELFTRAFDLAAPDSPIKAELAARINNKLAPGYHLDVNSWELEAQTSDGRTMRGMLQYGESHVSEDNPLRNLLAQERKDFQTSSVHQSLMNKIGTGGVTRLTNPEAKKRIARLDAMRRQRLPEEAEPGSLWRDLTFVNPQTYGPGSRWQERTGLEVRYYNRSIDRMKLYRQEIDFSSDVFNDDRVAIEQAITRVVDRLKLRPSDAELVHYWIRQVLYFPAESSDQEAFSGDRSPSDVLGALEHIHDNIEKGYLPTYNGAGPSFFSAHDLAVLFHASQRNENGWRPARKENDPDSRAGRDDLGEWVAIAFGQAINRSVPFDPVYRLDFSGFMNTYQQVLRNSGYMMDITLDKDYQRKLLDPQTNELLTVTVDPVEQTRLTEQVLAATANLEYDDLMVTQSNPNSAVWRERRLKALASWRARRRVHPVKVQSARDFVRNGTEHINRDADMHSLQRIVIALRHGTAMLNPGLYVSMLPEQGIRMFVSEATNAFTGESTLRTVSAVQRGIDRAVGAVTGGRGNFQLAQYTDKQIRELNELFTTLGNDGAFTSLIISDMMWQRDKNSPGKVVDFFEKYASIGNKWQDPTWGTTQKAIARHYFEAIMRSIESMPTKYALTTDSVIAALRTDPAYFARNHKDLHKMASNFVVDFRSLRNTPLSLLIKSIYEPMSRSSNMPTRFAGTLLKLQAMYSTYNMNILTTITGMQGYSDLLAVLLDGRRKPNSVISHWYKTLNGQKVTDKEFETLDMSSVLDGVTIANSFIRGGVTQTGLFLLGMASGGILSGEDEEARRRRRLAEAQGVPLIMDPRRLETDFRNKDVIFLDWMSPKLAAFFRVQGDDGVQGARSAAQISWILKPFLSPIMGMERFFMTGDFSYVTHGFMDAVGALPLFNKGKWDDAVRTAHELEMLAAEEQQAGTPTALKNAMYLLTSAVAVYESMFVENMFLNSFYTGLDMYDRDPTRLVLRDSDGVPQVDIENNPRPNDVALTDYVGEDGIGQGYKKRDPLSAGIAAYTENNFTAAAMMSLFTGFRKDYMRSQMPVRTQTIKMPELSEDEAKVAVILATLGGQQAAGQLERRLSLDEATSLIRTEAIKRQDWDTFNNLDAVAEQFYLSDANPLDDPMSIIGPDGQEVLTKSGHAALFKGLYAGTISLDDPEMRGIAISWDARREIEKDFFEDFTRQGIDIGLTRTQAENRAKRLLMGPIEDKTIIGFGDILYDKRIPSSADAKYKQLNTTYVTGPDGFPWATGYRRGGAPGMGGFWSLLGGLKRPTIGMTDAIDQDGRMNSADLVRGINTGLRGLVPMNDTEQIPTDWEQTQKILDALEGHNESFNSYVPNSRDSGNGSGTFYRRGYSRGGYGGRYGGGYSSRGYSPTIYWSRQPTLPRGTNVYGNSARNLFWNNANIRRTTIRRERYQSSRGRLNQWQ